MLRMLGIVVIVALLGTSLFEVVLALGAGSSTVKAGETPFGGDWIPLGAYVAMLIGGVVALGYVRSPSHLAALFAPAAALFLLAFSFTYDSYYAPSLVRYEQRDPGNWKLLLVASVVAGAVGLLAWIKPREGAGATAVMLVILVFVNIGIADGH